MIVVVAGGGGYLTGPLACVCNNHERSLYWSENDAPKCLEAVVWSREETLGVRFCSPTRRSVCRWKSYNPLHGANTGHLSPSRRAQQNPQMAGFFTQSRHNSRLPSYFVSLIVGKSKCDAKASVTPHFFFALLVLFCLFIHNVIVLIFISSHLLYLFICFVCLIIYIT